MKKISAVAIRGVVWMACILASGCAIAPPKLPPAEDIRSVDDLETYLSHVVEKGDPPGLSVVVVKGTQIVYQKGFGMADAPRKIVATPQTIYQWWSLTKISTAVAILQLEEKGRLDLDDPVEKHLDFFDVAYPEKDSERITIRHLLSHSSGLKNVGYEILGWIHFDDDPPFNQTTLLKEKLPKYNKLGYEPGKEGRYTNIGYMVLAAIIEAVSGQSYEGYVIEHILQPLGMTHTNFVYTDQMRPYEAAGSHPKDLMSFFAFRYIDKGRAVREKADGRYWFNHLYSDQKGSTGLIGPPIDLARFLMALLNGGEWKNRRILSPQSVAMMGEPIVSVAKSPAGKIPGQKFGLGWFYLSEDNRISLTHGGNGAAFVCMMRIYPEESLGIVVMANSTYLGRTMGKDIVDLVGSLDWQRLDHMLSKD